MTQVLISCFLDADHLGWWVVVAEFHQTASVSIWYWVFPTKARMRGRMRGLKKQRRASQPSIFTPPGRGAKVQRVRFITLSHSHTLMHSHSHAHGQGQHSQSSVVGKNTSRYRSTQQGRWVVYRAQFSLQLHLPVEDLTYYCDSLKHSRPENKFLSINITLLALSMSYFWWKSSIMKRATGLCLHSSKFRLWIFNLRYLCGHLYSAEGKGENTVLPWSGTMCIFSLLIAR